MQINKFFIASSLTVGILVSGMSAGHAFTPNLSYSALETELRVLVSADNKVAKGAENFIDSMGKRAIGFLDSGMSKDQKAREFRKLLSDSFDLTTIGRFSLGRHWKVASPAQKKEYQKLFENLVVEVYSQRFDEYQGQALKIRSSRAESAKDTIVQSYIVDDNNNEFSVDWRVRFKDGRYKIIDVIIEGVSMSLTQRSDFSSVIQRGGGNVDVLIAHLNGQN